MCPVLRPWDGKTDGARHPFALACIVLLPWSNRIGANGFHFEGRFYALQPNVEGEPYPLHGNAFQSAWELVRHDSSHAQLRLRSHSQPLAYEAQLGYTLDRGALTIHLSVTHRGTAPMPYGMGMHPWFTRHADSLLSFDASHYWSQTADYLPLARLANTRGEAMDFSMPKPLAQGWINAAFEGWGGSATLASVAAGLRTELRVSPSLGNLQLYSPSADAGFVCVEPISHVPNAHGLPGLTESAALTRLEPGQSLDGWLRMAPAAFRG